MTPRPRTTLALDERLLAVPVGHGSRVDAIHAWLAELAAALGVRRVVVAFDDPGSGRQVFCSDGRPSCGWPVGLTGPPRVCTDPPLPIPADVEAGLIESARTAFTGGSTLRAVDGRHAPAKPAPGGLDRLARPVSAAVARAVRYGWAFTLVYIGFAPPDDGSASSDGPRLDGLRTAVRAGDTLIELGSGGLGLILEGTRDEEVPPILARVAVRAGLPPFSFGLCHCPGDGTDAGALVETAIRRLAEARLTPAAQPPTIRAVGGAQR